MCASSLSPSEGFIPVKNAHLFYREIGQGRPIIVLHGGPDFDHTYLLPELDRLSDSYHLTYYDQRGRGRSADQVQPEDVTIESEIEDLESVRQYFQNESFVLLGHSWGGVLALEYALRYPDHLSHLILMNPAPVSHTDYLLLREERRKKWPADIEELKTRAADAKYQAGDPDAVAAYYRVHFRATLRQPEHLEKVIQRLRTSFTQEGILKAWAIENRLYNETWRVSEYNLLPKLKALRIPTLVFFGEYEFIPLQCATHIPRSPVCFAKQMRTFLLSGMPG